MLLVPGRFVIVMVICSYSPTASKEVVLANSSDATAIIPKRPPLLKKKLQKRYTGPCNRNAHTHVAKMYVFQYRCHRRENFWRAGSYKTQIKSSMFLTLIYPRGVTGRFPLFLSFPSGHADVRQVGPDPPPLVLLQRGHHQQHPRHHVGVLLHVRLRQIRGRRYKDNT